MPTFEALRTARGLGLDLVEVAPKATPPVCRIINYGKYLYQQSKRQHEAKKHQKSTELKEVKFRPRTSEHDFEVKTNRIREFLQEGSKVKATIMFRGRENAHRDLGMKMVQRLIDMLAESGQVESRPKQEGPNLTTIIAPKKTAAKSQAAGAGAGPGGATSTKAGPAGPKPSASQGSTGG